MESLQATPESHWLPLRSTCTLAMACDLLSDSRFTTPCNSHHSFRSDKPHDSWYKSWGESWGESWSDSVV